MEDLDPARRLGRLDACAVSDALDKLGLGGCVTGLPPLSVRKKVSGRVRTMRLRAKDQVPAHDGPPVHLGCAAIKASQPGDVIVVEQRSGIDCGSWGGILSLGAKLRGVAGVVADGPVRDIDEAVELGFPVYGRSGTARTARNRVLEEAAEVPVRIGDVTVRPGDFVLADSSAVVFVAAGEIARVLAAAEAIAAREAAMARAIMSGSPIWEVMGADYEHMLLRKG